MLEETNRMDVRWALRLYPRAWRDRYEDEVLALLEERGGTVSTLVDLLFGALDAHLDPVHLADHGSPGARLMYQLRSSSRLAFWAFPLFIFLYFVIIVDEVDIAWDTLRDTNPIAGAASWAMMIGALTAAFTILGAGLFLAASRVRAGGSFGERLRCALPLLAPPLVMVAAFGFHALVPAAPGWNSLSVPPFVFFWLGILALPIVVGRAAARDALSEVDARLLLLAASIVACAMVTQLGGMIVSQLVASAVWPGGNWSLQLVFGLCVLVLPTALAIRAVLRGFSALREARAA
jgi:hypothetical protein